MKMTKILLTGANGLLGQKLIWKLRTRDAVELLTTGRGPNRNIVKTGYRYSECDVTDYSSLRRIFETFKPSIVINAAAMTNVDLCEKERELCWSVNVKAVEYLATLCRDYSACLIHISTDFIFDGKAGPYDERAIPAPLSIYGRSKLRSEEIVQESGVEHILVRTVLVFGVAPDGSARNVVLWAKKALEEKQKINVVNDQWRTPTLAEDLAVGIITLAMKGNRGIFNISGSEMINILDLVRRVAAFWKLDATLINEVSSETLNLPAIRPLRTGFIILKAQTELGYHPHSFHEGLEIVDRQLKGFFD